MDDFGDSNIELNIVCNNSGFESFDEKKRIRGNRGQRIRARRVGKINKRKHAEISDGGLNNESKDNDVVSERKTDNSTSRAPAKKSKPDQVISSLFRHNPEIPKVHSSHVLSMKEKVFTSESFSELSLHPFMISNLEEKMKLNHMTSVQQHAVPTIIAGHDALIKSQTGSGKTLAYAVPIVQTLQGLFPKVQRLDGPYAIVVVPTRELALQSYDTFLKLVKPFIHIVPGCLMGGEKRKAEKARVRKGINILVGTPGRLVDHLQNTHGLLLDRVRYLVLDEADRLCDLGYEKDIAQIITALNGSLQAKRQTILLSATLTDGVERLAGISLSDPVKIDVSAEHGCQDEKMKKKTSLSSAEEMQHDSEKEKNFTIPENLKQHFVITPCKLRLVTLAAFVLWKCKLSIKKSKMIVFLSTQDMVEFHHTLFRRIFTAAGKETHPLENSDGLDSEEEKDSGLDLYKLHGDMPQKERTKVYHRFCQVSDGVLFCTDVASRGLHLPHVHWIVQYTSPETEADYVHRVGRTARAGAQGHSLLFLMPAEIDFIKILNTHKISLDEINMDKILKTLLTIVDDLHVTVTSDTKRERPRTTEEAATFLQMVFENYINNQKDVQLLAKKGFQSFIRAYATYPSQLKSVFQVKNLHLGHLAKSFALRDAPGDITVPRVLSQKHKTKRDKFEKKTRKRHDDMSEYASGFVSKKRRLLGPKKKKKLKLKQK